ncbi:MAG: restriction endonuclease subunit M [Desulfuromonadaceae bacterium GWB2_53_15]|nr:MAG: restriction endonuclease subunit M [Desulfuromonadales bacterium GWD2_54_10]OHB28287.1 MAG: restriction endonuclease subunit M [Desulfuromonadaceae bacterium GWB2_53_15]
MSLYEAYKQFAWPTPEQILNPSGAGPNVFAQLAKDKLGKAIERLQDGTGVRVGILAASPEDDATESPLAIVCEFQRTASEKTLQEAHRLAWNFSYAPLLITIEPGLVRAWSCCEEPPGTNENNPFKAQIKRYELGNSEEHGDLSSQAARSLHWVQLVSGQYFKENESHFKRDHCADYLLLENLKGVRQKLIDDKGLDSDICHDLLARIIFVQFLFHRKDSKGRPALDTTRLNRLYEDRILSARYEELAQILENYDDSYALFQWLNNKFNGDLFPGKAQTEEERQAEWQKEKDNVRPEHLSLLADFVSGKIVVVSGQMSLWPQYSFDAIPIEFISSIYETFVGKKKGVVYTPGYLVDFILDGVLPWNDENWDVKVLDPACGSGIFLVKAYQRLIHRWKKANRQEPEAKILRGLLERNLFGVDIDPHAVRVASFSLYLAMCDAIDPRHYWDQVKFPQLRNRRLIASDFFADDIPGFRSVEDKASYDLVIGNAPWGKNSVTKCSLEWNEKAENKWEVTYGDVGPLFLPKAAALLKKSGFVSMLQPAMAMLFNQIDSATIYRKRLFENFKIEEVVNLSALRFGLFSKAISPACIITIRDHQPTGEPLSYICPKPTFNSTEEYRVTIDPRDINPVYPHEAAIDPLVWTTLMWGGRRDLAFIKSLRNCKNLEYYETAGNTVSRQGIIRGDRTKVQNSILGKRILDSKELPMHTFLSIDAKSLPENFDPRTHSKDSTKYDAFRLPQLIIKQGWQQKRRRFQAALIASDEKTGAILCSKSYVSVHCKVETEILRSASLSLNSKLGVYFLRLTSGRFCSYRPEPNVQDLLRIPLAEPNATLFNNIQSYEDVDSRVQQALGVKESEWILVEDLFDYTLPDFGTDNNTSAYALTRKASNTNNEMILESYCHSFLKVLRAGFGEDINVSATIFQEMVTFLPVRMVAIHFDFSDGDDVRHESITSPDLLARLQELNTKFMDISKAKGGIFYQRVVRVYDSVKIDGKNVPTVYLIKPDQVRYWTRSMALRDADDVAADALLWRKQALLGVAMDSEPARA